MMHVITDRQIVYVCGMRLCVMHVRRRNKCWKSCANGSNIVALRFGDHDLFQTARNNSQQHATTCNRVCKRTQHVTANNVVSVCTGL